MSDAGNIEQSYFRISRVFDAWVRLMEFNSRKREAEAPLLSGSKILIISPPTDAGIKLLANANVSGETFLLCFSERLAAIAETYARAHEAPSLDIRVEPFFRLPFADVEIAAIYANCFFDFCSEEQFDLVIGEMRRVLKADGMLFAAYMGMPRSVPSRLWAWLFRRFDFIGQGCRPVSIEQWLSRHGLMIHESLFTERLGFPLTFIVARLACSAV